MKNALVPLFYRSFSLFGCARYDRTRYVIPTIKLRDTTNVYPYISGDLFRTFSDHVVDATGSPFYPRKVQEGDIVFVKAKYLRRFIKYMHPCIKNRYILITHNGDEEAPGNYAHLLEDDQIILWAGVNATLSHPKLIPLPIGFGNSWNNHFFDHVLETLHQSPTLKKNLLYLNMSEGTHPDRPAIKEYFATRPFCTAPPWKSHAEYLHDLTQSKFTLSPRGNGIDCCRVWECLLLGSIPVLKTTPLDPLYQDLPVVIVQDWTDVTEEFLEQKYREMSQKEYNFDKCYADYWLQQIASYARPNDRFSRVKESSRNKNYQQPKASLRPLFWAFDYFSQK